MEEEKRFRVYRQLEWPEPAKKLVWRLCAKDEQPGSGAKTGKRTLPSDFEEKSDPVAKSGESSRSIVIDLTQDDD